MMPVTVCSRVATTVGGVTRRNVAGAWRRGGLNVQRKSWLVIPVHGEPLASVLSSLSGVCSSSPSLLAARDLEHGLTLLTQETPEAVFVVMQVATPEQRRAWHVVRDAAVGACRIVLAGPAAYGEADTLLREGAHEVLALESLTPDLARLAVRYGMDRLRWNVQTGGDREIRLQDGTVVPLCGLPACTLAAHATLTPPQAACEVRALNIRLSDALTYLKRAQMLIMQSERRLAVGQVTARVMHDFNNALMPIMGYTDLLLEDPALMERRADAFSILNEIRVATQRAADEIRQLRQCCLPDVRMAPEANEGMDLNRLVEHAVAETRGRWERVQPSSANAADIRLRLGALPKVPGHGPDVRDALVNLLMNAFESLSTTGWVEVTTSMSDGHVTVTVRDNGQGMSAATLERCCDPFFSTKGAHAAGIGLAVVKGVVHAHGGRLTFESRPGEGTEVTLALPLQPTGYPAGSGTAAFESFRARPLRILLVDDDVEVLRLLGRHLESQRHDVAMAGDGDEALGVLRRKVFDLLIVDRAMPRMGGDVLVQQVREQGLPMPILMLTGLGDLVPDGGGAPAGVTQVLSKPVALDDLDRALAAFAPLNEHGDG